MTRLAALGAVMLAGLVLMNVSGLAARHGPSALLPIKCKLAGIHYVGTTKQGQKVCLTLTSDGKSLRQYQFGGRFKCDNGSTQGGGVYVEAGSYSIQVDGLVTIGASGSSSKIVTKLRNGRFTDYPGGIPSKFTGTIRKATASGTLRQRFVYGNVTTSMLTCDLGTTAWSARRAPR